MGQGVLSFIERMSSLWGLNWYNREGTTNCVFHREVFSIVSFIGTVHYYVVQL